MDETVLCPGCHIAVRPLDYFCFNCGKNLHVAPQGTKLVDQMKLYVGSILLAPMGIFWGLKYVKENDDKTKIIGVVAMIISGVTFIIAAQYTLAFINSLNTQVGQQLQGIEGF